MAQLEPFAVAMAFTCILLAKLASKIDNDVPQQDTLSSCKMAQLCVSLLAICLARPAKLIAIGTALSTPVASNCCWLFLPQHWVESSSKIAQLKLFPALMALACRPATCTGMLLFTTLPSANCLN